MGALRSRGGWRNVFALMTEFTRPIWIGGDEYRGTKPASTAGTHIVEVPSPTAGYAPLQPQPVTYVASLPLTQWHPPRSTTPVVRRHVSPFPWMWYPLSGLGWMNVLFIHSSRGGVPSLLVTESGFGEIITALPGPPTFGFSCRTGAGFEPATSRV